MRHKILAFLGAFDFLRPNKADKITAETQIRYTEPLILDDLDLVYWGFIKDKLGSFEPVYIDNLRIVKRPSNNDDSIIQNLDFAEGWVNENLFVSGFWKGDDDPTLSDLQNKDNWSEFIEIE